MVKYIVFGLPENESGLLIVIVIPLVRLDKTYDDVRATEKVALPSSELTVLIVTSEVNEVVATFVVPMLHDKPDAIVT